MAHFHGFETLLYIYRVIGDMNHGCGIETSYIVIVLNSAVIIETNEFHKAFLSVIAV